MTQIPAGWYPDPDPEAPEPKGQRYWDGQQWTEHVQPAPGQSPTAPPAYAGYGYPTAGGYGGVQVARATTPDGQELSGWWRRLVAYFLDGVLLGVITTIVAFPWVRDVMEAYGRFLDEAFDAAAAGSAQTPDSQAFLAEVSGSLLAVSLVALVVSFVYNAAFLRWKAATPGKLALGLRIRLRETPGPLSWSTILTRWAAQNAYTVVNYIPVIGFLGLLYWLLDHLWPIWDTRKQALHDKIAATNVVRHR